MSWLRDVGRAASAQSTGVAAARELDPRAVENGREIADHLATSADACVMITGPSHTGKTQSAIAARRLLDPTGESSMHTSAAILLVNAKLVPSDRSALWQGWSDIAARHKDGRAPKLLVIDEAGSAPPPERPMSLEEAYAKKVLTTWREQGTKFIVIGHSANPSLTAWAEWLSGANAHYAALDTRG
ncbi:ATP-binding protein [Myxococcota bacterium]|nr:ATP-binding protein [Myxococcota bacterium]